jgi:predicted CXXCH cytochrome family protein
MSFVTLYAQNDSFKFLYPQDYKLQTELTLNILIETHTQNFDTLEFITPKEQIDVDVDNSKSIYCENISLRLGENKITIRTYKNSVMLDEKIRHVYVTSELYHQYKYPPEQYKNRYFHNDKNEAKCLTCHDMSVNEIKDVAFIDVTKSNCYECHKNITREKYGHAPAVNWLCTSCHNINSKDASKYGTIEPISKSCFHCHKENKELWDASRYHHEPLDSGHCNKCHNSHASPYEMFLRKPVNEICVGCHKDKHIRAIQDKNSKCAYKDKEFCISCHTPHAANKPFFLEKRVKVKK